MPDREPAFHARPGASSAPGPPTVTALGVLRAVMDERIERLEGIVAELEEIAEAEAAEAADRAAFDPSPAFDRHRRHQASLGRELLRTVETLRRLRREARRDRRRPKPAEEGANDGEVCENTTIEANRESTQEPMELEVTSNPAIVKTTNKANPPLPKEVRRWTRFQSCHQPMESTKRTTGTEACPTKGKSGTTTKKTRRTKPNWNRRKIQQKRRLHRNHAI